MDKFDFLLYTISIIVFCNILGFFISLVSIHSDYLQKYRIQKRKIKASTFYNRLPLIFFNIFLLLFVSSLGLYYLYPILFEQTLSFHFSTMLIQLLIILLIDDLYFYFLHSWMHKNKYVLNKIHRIHHKAISPFALEYIYVHPLEWIMGYFGPFIAIFIISFCFGDFGYVSQGVSILAFWFYQLIRNIHELDVHSGFRSFFSKWIPFWGESEHHDMHHEKLNGNYATTFTIWDRIFNTKINNDDK
tara:strand:- start:47 stop:781 length:735 start_codon:yes stop_codon:yes gene_type:complete